ncbi:MAG: insulinase family protein [Fidelibacterota bacterium]|nr:MAG: insulinase family protein [Candidatus Neomarinimicrobiota bacterium]
MRRSALFVIPLMIYLAFSVSCSVVVRPPAARAAVPDDLGAAIPPDPDLTMGEFPNGVRYYIRVNGKPEKRAQLWLAIDAGSVLEDDDQRGLAHFAEHMAFNGTEHFAKQEIIDYLESIGMRFGPEVNAFTSFDETVYMLQVPTDSIHMVEQGFQILEDWAHLVSFDEEEIDKERGVIVEEWRLGRGANMRLLDKQLPVLFKGSKYAVRLPIGKKEIIEASSYETLRRYYREWYRPDLMAVVAVGDFDKDWIFGLIEKHFAAIPEADDPRPREVFPVPDHDEALFAIATDPEASFTSVSLYFKSDLVPEASIGDYRHILIRDIYNQMLNNRLSELAQQSDPPFLAGYSGKGRFVRSKDAYFLGARVKEDGIGRGLEALMTEATRVRKYGFTPSELERARKWILRSSERIYKERDKTESETYVWEYVQHFLNGYFIMGAEKEYELGKRLVPGITLEEVNGLTRQWITDHNRVVLVSGPEKEDVAIPSAEQLSAVFAAVEEKEILAYEDRIIDEPLVAQVPEPAKIAKKKTFKDLGVTEWTLANGVRVVLKPTDFKNDEVLFYAYSPGGHSLIADEDFMSGNLAADIIDESGVGPFDNVALAKKLTGKVVGVTPYINALKEGFRGNASPEDLETMFQLIYLYMTSPRQDSVAFQSLKTRIKGFIENRSAQPEAAYQDTLQVTLAQYHHRARPWTGELLDEVQLAAAFRFYRERFADVSDFVFFFVGNFTLAEIEPLVRSYLGGLPSLKRDETWRDPGVHPPKGVVRKTVNKGMEPKSLVRLVFTGPYDWSRENNYALQSMLSAARIKLREVLREDLGGTYSVGVWGSGSLYPRQEYRVNVTFGCSPERVDELIGTVFEQIDSLNTTDLGDLYVTKVRESQYRSYETSLKENGFWLNQLHTRYFRGEDPRNILAYPELVETLTAEMIRQAAARHFNTDNYVQVVLMPEGVR